MAGKLLANAAALGIALVLSGCIDIDDSPPECVEVEAVESAGVVTATRSGVYPEPSTDGDELEVLEEEEEFTLLGYRFCDGELSYVRVRAGDIEGWTVAGTTNVG